MCWFICLRFGSDQARIPISKEILSRLYGLLFYFSFPCLNLVVQFNEKRTMFFFSTKNKGMVSFSVWHMIYRWSYPPFYITSCTLDLVSLLCQFRVFQATKLYCFVHKVPVCGECICFPEHQICVVNLFSLSHIITLTLVCYLSYYNLSDGFVVHPHVWLIFIYFIIKAQSWLYQQ